MISIRNGYQIYRRKFVAVCTSRCNFNCPHCLRQIFDDQKRKQIDFPVDLFEYCIKEFRRVNYGHVSLTGGEPIMHPEFEKLIAAAAVENFTFNIVSNAWFYRDYLPILEKYRLLLASMDFSLDGSTADIHDKIRGKSDSYKKVIEAIESYRNHGFPITVISCFNRHNLFDIKNICKLVDFLGVRHWIVSATNNVAGDATCDYALSDKERLFLKQEILKLQEKFHNQQPALYIRMAAGVNSDIPPHGIDFCRGLSRYFSPVAYPDGGMLFCCDIHKECAGRPNIIGDGFWPSFDKNMVAVVELKRRRLKDILENNLLDGSSICDYCNGNIEEILQNL